MNTIERAREIVKIKTDLSGAAYEIGERDLIDNIVDIIDFKAGIGENILGSEEWEVLRKLVFEGDYTGNTVNTKESIEKVLSYANEYIKNYKCLVHFIDKLEVEDSPTIGVLYESPGNSTSEALQRSESYAKKNRDDVRRRFDIDWIAESIVSGFETYPPRPSKYNLSGVDDRVQILDMGIELEP